MKNPQHASEASSGDDHSLGTVGAARSRLSRGEADHLDLLASAVSEAADGVVLLSPQNRDIVPRILYVNDAFGRMMKRTADHFVGTPLESIRFTPAELDQTLASLLHGGIAFACEGLAVNAGGELFPAYLQGRPVRRDGTAISHWALYLRDVSVAQTQLLALERRAQYDALTGLPNRVLLFDRLDQAVLSHVRNQTRVGVMVIDLDGFKDVNDAYGHEAGDALLKNVAVRLQEVLRRSDTVARLGGDEFAIILPQVDNLRAAGEVAAKLVTAVEEPIDHDGRALSVRASIGVALCPDHGLSGADLLRRADLAMYRAKRTRGVVCEFDVEQERDSTARMELARDLKQAISDGEIYLHYQPEVNLADDRVLRVEALARWQSPRHGAVPPDQFIPIAEQIALIQRLTQHVIRNAARDSTLWQSAGARVGLSVNLSADNLRETSLPEMIAETLREHGISPEQFQVEITESSLVEDPAKALAVLSLIRSYGISVAIDDFGTGYSSLTNLRLFPFDEIKIDRSFVMGIAESEQDAAIVRATIRLAHDLGTRVVAEGVEDERILEMLRSYGCDAVQGFLISKPLPAAEVAAFLTGYEQSAVARRWNAAGTRRGGS